MYEFAGFRLDPRSRRLLRGAEVVPITVKGFDTLVALVEHAGQVVEKDELMRRVWPDAIVEEANLSQQVFLLRKALGEGPKEHRFIQTVPRQGFRFVAPVTILDDASTTPSRPENAGAGRWQIMRLQLALAGDAPLALGASSPFALSPDGRRLAYIASESSGTALHIRPLDRVESARVAKSAGATGPFFSPDGRWVGFFAGGRLYKVLASGGAPIPVCDAGSECRGAAWTPGDEIVFAPTPAAGLVIVPADGGVPRPATTLDFSSGERTHRWPEVLPDGNHVLFTVARAGSASFDEAEIAVATLDGGQRHVVVRHGSCGRFLPTGHLVYMRGGSIMAVPFDRERRVARGAAIPVVDQVMAQPTGAGHFSASQDGCLLYLTGDAHDVKRGLVWVDGSGRTEPLRVPELAIEEPRLSPDGRRIAFGIRGATNDIWVHSLDQKTLVRSTFEGDNFAPIWTPDGARLTFSSNRYGPCHIFWQDASGGDASKIVGGDHDLVPGSWSREGDRLLFTEYNPQDGACIWVCAPRGGADPSPLVRCRGNAFAPTLAPDGRSFAYTSDESGRPEVYIASFPDARVKTQITLDGGAEPIWAPDGRRLHFRNGSSLMAVDIAEDGVSRCGDPRTIADGPFQPGAMTGLANYDVAADGRLLLIAQTAAPAHPDRLSVIVNWFADLTARVG